MKLSPRYTLILVAVGVLLVVVVAAVVLVVPQFSKLADVEAQYDAVDDQVSQAESMLQARQAAKDNAAFTDAELLELAAAVPEQPDLPSLIIELQDVAYENNVQIRSVEPGDLVAGEGVAIMPLSLTVWGAWADTVDFTQSLRRMTRQVRTAEVAAAVLGEGDTDEALEALDPYALETVIQLETYVVPTSTESTTAAPAPAPTTGQ